jgi:thiamine-monophosphate kinase
MGEFELIAKYFQRPHAIGAAAHETASGIRLGIGDDCALLTPAPGHELNVSTDLLVAGTHFFADTDPERLGHKVLAVNLSDLAAMGARPRWCTLAMALPKVDEAWLAAFSRGFFSLADRHGIALVGGDTTRGPMAFCVTVMGETPSVSALHAGVGNAAGKRADVYAQEASVQHASTDENTMRNVGAIRRSGARTGDDVWVSGTLGWPGAALDHLMGKVTWPEPVFQVARERLEKPEPRVALGQALRGIATAMLDVSDGLAGDLPHLLRASNVAATLDLNALPLPAELPRDAAERYALTGGDEYELCFAASPENAHEVGVLGRKLGVRVTRVGSVQAGVPVVTWTRDGVPVEVRSGGFDHFKK